MGSTTQQVLTSVLKDQIGAVEYNLARAGDPNARKIDSQINISNVGGGKAIRVSVYDNRNVDKFQETVLLGNLTKLEELNPYTEFLGELQTVVDGEDNHQVSRVVNSISDFFAQAKLIEANSGTSMLQAFIDKAEAVCETISSASQKVIDLRLEADRRISTNINNMNQNLKSLFDLNFEIQRSSSPTRLLDRRDTIVRELAKNFEINVTPGGKETIIVKSKSSGLVLLDAINYTQFHYDGFSNQDNLLGHDTDSVISYATYDVEGNQVRLGTFYDSGDDINTTFNGGSLKALIDLRDKVLVGAGDLIKSLGRNFTNKLNLIHNNGSPFPPKGFFQSEISVGGRDTLDWGDAFNIYFLNPDGDNLRGGAGLINSASIDMKNLPTSSTSGKATVADLIKELNEKLDLGPFRERAAIGAIRNNVGVQIPGEYLLNNIQLRAKGAVNLTDNNSLLFDLDLQGNAHFDSTIEIIEVRTADDVAGTNSIIVPQSQLPEDFILKTNTNTATNQNIKVDGVENGKVITIRLRITGENGEVSEGSVSFNVNEDIKANERIAYDSLLIGSTTDGFDHPGVVLNSNSSIARAKLIDENGLEIDPSSNIQGKLVIETTNNSYKLAIQDGNFGAQFGFHNLFNFDERLGSMSVNQEIVKDVNQIAIGRASRDAGILTAHSVGDEKATTNLTFDFGGGAIALNDTISINNVTFTFVNALSIPANPNEVLIADLFNGNDGLINRINKHPQLSKLVDVSGNGLTLSMVASNPGLAVMILMFSLH